MRLWVARDAYGYLYLYQDKPIKDMDNYEWTGSKYEYISLANNVFPQVKWEDPEPTEVELMIKIKEKGE